LKLGDALGRQLQGDHALALKGNKPALTLVSGDIESA